MQSIQAALESLKKDHRFRSIPNIDYGADKHVLLQERHILNLASNNYLGFSERAEIRRAAVIAAQNYGTTSGASRLVSGTYGPYDALEEEVARFKGTEAALIFNSGYAANLAICSSLADRNCVIFSDRLNHASIVDGIILSRATHVRYRHNDMAHLEKCLEKHAGTHRKIVITDSVFSMDGDMADVAQAARLCKSHGALLVLDEAHAAGVLGQGRGLASELGVADQVDLHMGTFSKAMGSFGAYVAGSRTMIDWLMNTARSFIYSTSLPPSVIGANREALRIVQNEPQTGKRLMAISKDLRDALNGMGFDTGQSQTQIIPVILGDNGATLAARDFLLQRGLLVGAIRPPTVPKGTARLRLSLRADLTDREMEEITDTFRDLRQNLPVVGNES
ncbi:MAG: 8-amino-7-oxononanoate synthase [Desulfovibrio sp.]|uniref:8-amino-7-oxononanoate synthase n=1 Tax=Desulfovibrio sp. 7SRBS1 TaxID=3378064 RepID=UPI003B3F776A